MIKFMVKLKLTFFKFFKLFKKISVKLKINRFLQIVNWSLFPYLLVMTLLIVIPLIFVGVYSLLVPSNNALQFLFNFKHYQSFFVSHSFVNILLITFSYAFIASLMAVIIAYPVGYVIAFTRSRPVILNLWILVTIPIFINLILRIIGLQSLFNMINPNLIGSPLSVIFGMVYAFLPFAILPIFNSLTRFDHNLLNAASDLGANRWQAFFTITLPHSYLGIITSFTLMMIQTSTTLLVVHYMGAGKINLIVQLIQSYFFQGNNFAFGAAVSVILSLGIIIILVLSNLSKRLVNRNL